MSTPLQESIEELYRVFQRYPRGGTEGCPCCVSPEEVARLWARPLRQLGDDDLGSFAFSALNTWGTLNGFKHFLPRILELKAQRALWTDTQVIYSKLVQEGPWLDEELRAVERFTELWFLHSLDEQRHHDVLDVLEGGGMVGFSLPRMMDLALASPDNLQRATALASLVIDIAPKLASTYFGWIWWKEGPTESLREWMLNGRLRAYLLRVFEAHLDDARAGDWASASDILEALGG